MSQASTMAATITKASGPVIVEREGQSIELKQGASILASDTIKTQSSSVELTFKDGAKAMLGPDSTMKVQEFTYEMEDSSFVLNLTQGVMRSISGKVVEQNPDAFKVFTPKATVGIRGTDFVTKVNPDASEVHFVLSLDQGHNLVLTTHDGQQISITMPEQGAFIAAGESSNMTPHSFTMAEIDAILEPILSRLKELLSTELEEERTNGLDEKNEDDVETNSYDDDTSQVTILLDQTLLDFLNQGGTFGPLDDEASLDDDATVDVETSHPNDYEDDDNLVLLPNDDDDSDSDDLSVINIDGSTSYYADMNPIVGGTHVLGSQHINIDGDIDDGVIISGDTGDVSGGAHVTGGDDEIDGDEMSDGTVVGDAHTVQDSTLVGGDDDISFDNKTGGDSIYGDAYSVTNAVQTDFGDDTIAIENNFTSSTISGDVNIYGGATNTVSFGDDVITVQGSVNTGALIYGDYVTWASATGEEGGNDSITVGTLNGGSIYGGGGADSVTIGSLNDGLVDLGNDSAADILDIETGGGKITIENFDTNVDKLIVNGQEQSIIGDGNYGGITIDFGTIKGNINPFITSATAVNVSEDTLLSGSGNVLATDANAGDVLSYGFSRPDNSGNMVMSLATTYGSITIDATGNFIFTLNNAQSNVQALGANISAEEKITVYVKDSAGAWDSHEIIITIQGTNDAPVLAVSNGTLGDVSGDLIISKDIASVQGKATVTDVDKDDSQNFSVDAIGTTTVNGTYGSLTIESDGTYTYTVDPSKVTNIDKQNPGIENFTIYVQDGAGATVSENITVTVTGENQPPVITSVSAPLTVTEDTLPVSGVGSVQFMDNDLVDTVTFTFAQGSTFAVQDTTSQVGYTHRVTGLYGDLFYNENSGAYLYVLDPMKSDFLTGMQSVEETFSVVANDGYVDSNIEEVKVFISGTNDAPTVTVPAALFVQESGIAEDSAAVTATDPDSSTFTFAANNGVHDLSQTGYDIKVLGMYGDLYLNSQSGKYKYVVDGNRADVLSEGQRVNDSFSITANDGSLSSAPVQVDVTVEGTNDAPTLSISATDSAVTEHVDNLASGVITFSDVDGNDIISLTVNNITIDTTPGMTTTVSGVYGNLVVRADGSYEYTLGATVAQQNAVALLGTTPVTESFTVSISDGIDSAQENIEISVTGTNDAPTNFIATPSDAFIYETGDGRGADGTDLTDSNPNLDYAGDFTASGTLSAQDNNAQDDLTFTARAEGSADAYAETVSTVYGDLTITNDAAAGDRDASYSFTLAPTTAAARAEIDALTHGQQKEIKFEILVSDGNGGTTPFTLTVTVTGTNDQPTLTVSNNSLTLTEDAGVIAGNLVMTGTSTVVDPDTADTQTFFVGEAGQDVGLTLDAGDALTAQGGDFFLEMSVGGIIDAAISATVSVGANGSYTVTVDNDSVQHLGQGETATGSFTIYVQDAEGAWSSQEVSVTVTGTSDGPTGLVVTPIDAIIYEAGDGRGADGTDLTDFNPNLDYAGDFTASGTLSAKDADTNDALIFTARAEGSADAYGETVSTMYGDLTITNDAAAGDRDANYSFTLAPTTAAAKAEIDALTHGQQKEIKFDILVSDGNGGTTPSTLTVTVVGTNDQPTLAVSSTTLTLTEDAGVIAGNIVMAGTATVVDPDTADTQTFFVGETGQNVGLTLDAGDGLTAQGGDFSIELSVPTIPGSIIPATVSIDQNGNYTVSVDNASVQHLGAGETATGAFTIYVQDAEGAWSSQEVSVTVTGVDDAADISVTLSDASVTESGVVLNNDNPNTAFTGDAVASGSIDIVDADGGNNTIVVGGQTVIAGSSYSVVYDAVNGTYSLTQSPVADFLGTITFTGKADGFTYEFSLNNTSATVNGIAQGDSLNMQLGISVNGVNVTDTIDIQLTGTNDLPILTAGNGQCFGSDPDGDAVTLYIGVTGQNVGTAIDGADKLTAVDSALALTYGSVTLHSNGSYFYTGDSNNPAYAVLSDGETVNDSFVCYVQDAHGAWVSKTVNIEVVGENDSPEIIITQTTDNEVTVGGLDTTVKGVVQVNDVDNDGNIQTYGASVDVDGSSVSATATTPGGDVLLNGKYGQLTLSGSTGEYVYTLGVTDAQKNALTVLGDDGEATENFTITTTDAHNFGDGGTVNIAVKGQDVRSVLGLATDRSITKFSADQAVVGKLAVTNYTTLTVNGNDAMPTGSVSVAGTYGVLTMNSDGTYTYNLYTEFDNGYANVDALGQGQSGTDTFTIVTTGVDSDSDSTSELVVTVNGADNNSAIRFSPDSDLLVYTNSVADIKVEGSVEIVGFGGVTVNDQQVVDGENFSIINSYGTFTLSGSDGNWAYLFNLDVTSPDVLAVKAGETKDIVFTFKTQGEEKSVIVTIVGQNVDTTTVKEHSGDLTTTFVGDADDGTEPQHNILTLKGHLGNGGIISGDALNYTGGGYDDGGNDLIIVEGDATGTGLIVGDVYQDATSNASVVKSGHDTITVKGALSGATIMGDSGVYDSSSGAGGGGDDVITVDSMSSGTIYGDNINDAANETGGDDSITVKNEMSGGTIEGQGGRDSIEVGSMSGGAIESGRSDDKVTVNGFMQNGSIDTGESTDTITVKGVMGTGASILSGAGSDVISVHTLQDDAVIRAGSEDDRIYVNNMSGGSVYGEDGQDLIAIDLNTFTGGHIDGGNGTDAIKVLNALNTAFTVEDFFAKHDVVSIENFDFAEIASGGSVTSLDKTLISDVDLLSGGSITGGDYNDNVNVTTMSSGSVSLGKGNDRLDVVNYQDGTVDTGEGNDTLYISDIQGGSVVSGAGNDSIILNTATGGTVDASVGDDIVEVDINDLSTGILIDGGEGTDTLAVSVSGFTGASINLSSFTSVQNVENIHLTVFDQNTKINGTSSADNLRVALYAEGTHTIATGAGNDMVELRIGSDAVHTDIELGAGQDTVNIDGINYDSTITLKDFDLEDALWLNGQRVSGTYIDAHGVSLQEAITLGKSIEFVQNNHSSIETITVTFEKTAGNTLTPVTKPASDTQDYFADGSVQGVLQSHSITYGESANLANISQDVSGDVFRVTGQTEMTFGNDNIVINGDVSDSGIVYGDAYSVEDAGRTQWGKDFIKVTGTLTGAIYGDAYSVEDASENNNARTSIYGAADVIIANAVNTGTIYGGGGNDDIMITGLNTSSRVYGGTGNDEIVIKGGINNSQFHGDDGNDSITATSSVGTGSGLYGGAGDDLFTLVNTTPFTTISGGEGDDTLRLTQYVGERFNLSSYSDIENYVFDSVSGTYGEIVMVAGKQVVVSTLDDEATITGSTGNDIITITDMEGATIDTGAGNDSITASEVSNVQYGEKSQILAGSGDDTINLAPDDNMLSTYIRGVTVDGGSGKDSIMIDRIGNGYNSVTSSVSGGDDDDVISVNSLAYCSVKGDAGDDSIVIHYMEGTSASVSGGIGNDTITIGQAGTGYVYGDEGTNTIIIKDTGVRDLSKFTIDVGSGSDSLIFENGLNTSPEGVVTVRNFDFANDSLTIGSDTYNASSNVTLQDGTSSTLSAAVSGSGIVNFDGILIHFT